MDNEKFQDLMLDQFAKLFKEVQGVKDELTGVKGELAGVKTDVAELKTEIRDLKELFAMYIFERQLSKLTGQRKQLKKFLTEKTIRNIYFHLRCC